MRKIILTKGLPGSGKTTWAKETAKKYVGQYKRVNKDDLRMMLDDGTWGRASEKLVLQIRDTIILSALNANYNVIVDDTNLHPKHELKMKDIASAYKEVTGKPCVIEIKDFTDVPVEVCIERDLKRPKSVGQQVIKDMYNQFLKPEPPKFKKNPKLNDVIICDIDGTIALFGKANPYDRDFTKDTPNEDVVCLLKQLIKEGASVIFVSGRKESARTQTLEWLSGVFPDLFAPLIFMRKDDDNRKDVIVKREIYDTFIKDKYNVFFVLDDRDQVVQMWRGLGLLCLQVAEGNF